MSSDLYKHTVAHECICTWVHMCVHIHTFLNIKKYKKTIHRIKEWEKIFANIQLTGLTSNT